MRDHGATARSVLLVDFDNIYLSLLDGDPRTADAFASDPEHWTTWLEGDLVGVGRGTPLPGPRRFLQKICYLNPRHSRYRLPFTRAGFRVVDCPSLTNKHKNGADIQMVVDALDVLAHQVRYDEFFVLSFDSDFTALFHRLREHDRYVVMLGNELAATAFRRAADLVIDDTTFAAQALGRGSAGPPLASRPQPRVPALHPTTAATSQQSGGDIREQIVTGMLRALEEATEPVLVQQLSHRLSQDVGPAAKAHWDQHGGFTRFVLGLSHPGIVIQPDGTRAWIYDSSRHGPPRTSALPAAQPPLEPEVLRERLHRLLGVPAFTSEQWTALFVALAEALGAGDAVLDEVEGQAVRVTGLVRSQVHYVVMGLRLVGFPFWEGGHSPSALGEAFLGNVLQLADDAQLPLADADRDTAERWLLGGLPPQVRR